MNRILVIEDDDPVRENIVDLLTAEGYYPIQARDGEEGAHLAWEWLPDLIVCDILLPHLDGYGVLAKLSRDPATATIPFIFLTALGSQDQIRKGMGLGADDYLTKPFNLNDLLKSIEIRLQKNRTLSQQARRVRSESATEQNDRLPRELLPPLNQVLRGAQVLLEQGSRLEPGRLLEIAGQIHQLAGQMIHRTQNQLFLADLEVMISDPASLLEYQKAETINAQDVINEIAQAVAFQSQRQADLVLDLGEAHLKMAYDHLLKMMEELLTYAFQVTSSGESVQMTGRQLPKRKVYQLKIGLRDWKLDDEMVERLSSSDLTPQAISGTSQADLGLVIIWRLVDLYRGQIQYIKETSGGAKITLSLPLANGFRQKV